ncbi:MAG: cyclic nucleotide-binding domain-containing protein [Nitrospinota bacterium]
MPELNPPRLAGHAAPLPARGHAMSDETPHAQPPAGSGPFIVREGDVTAGDLIWKLKKNYPFFADMNQNELVHLLRLCERRLFPAGGVIFRRGAPGEDFYLILSGEVSILAGDKELARLGAGECLGEMGVIEGAPRSATARAATRTLLLRIDARALGGESPALTHKLLAKVARQISARLREANERLWKHNL